MQMIYDDSSHKQQPTSLKWRTKHSPTKERKKEIQIGQGQKSKIPNPNWVLKIEHNYKRRKANAERRHTWTWTHGLVQTRKINKSQVRLIKAERNNPTVEEKEQGVWKQEELIPIAQEVNTETLPGSQHYQELLILLSGRRWMKVDLQ